MQAEHKVRTPKLYGKVATDQVKSKENGFENLT